ncbi:hypothetical protein E0F15_18605 [Frankia sp. B2]|uniref:Glycosyltransferase 2-like domain-containing protein n=1 Tax=Frankia casuarinae (strain DSM 45818 / CECT 9043 / HFP020203 / CcI3) TaxID=106370 RepID=Q2JGD1_FRACC|nr:MULTISPECIES: glycosyltransferase [Frankia]ABD09661.1 hypothetical protein Francci3_0274 [Frankia casuarinae]KDA43921.1 hypothetical protein BMG523Draft_01305 [Frankia sp. BMG5.23]OAA26966.1 hypothetical protein AAY23_102623 [Frankia casuarinae]TFE26140.1 hypothetical protein E0F15_18605 [Frankia sp. B2]
MWRGMAEQRQFLLDASRGRYVLYLDDDVLCEPALVDRLLAAIRILRCGFVGTPPQGLSHVTDVRPHEQKPFETVTDAADVRPERVRKGTPGWERWRLHNAANLTHITADLARRGRLPAGGCHDRTEAPPVQKSRLVTCAGSTGAAVGRRGPWPAGRGRPRCAGCFRFRRAAAPASVQRVCSRTGRRGMIMEDGA